MPAVLPIGKQMDLFDYLAGGTYFQQPPAIALPNEGIPIGKSLAGVNLAGRLIGKYNLFLSRDLLYAVSSVEEKIPVREHPNVICIRCIIAPNRFAAGIDNEYLALCVVSAHKCAR
jgi:hypothetical protein